MGIVMTSGGVSKIYNYYPYDALYVDANGNVNTNGNGTQVMEAWFNGVKYYPIGEKPSFRLELRFSNSPHHFDKSDVATYSRIVNDRNYYNNFLNVDESQWIYSTLSISTFNPPIKQWGNLTDYSIHTRIVFPTSFNSDNTIQKFAFNGVSYTGKAIDSYAQKFSNWPNYYSLGNYDESYYYKNNTVHTSKYYLHNGVIYCYIQPYMNWSKESGQEVYFSTLLNSNRSYEFYIYDKSNNIYDNSNKIRLVAEYSGGNLTVYEGYVYAVHMSASDEVSRLLQHTGQNQLPTYNSH